MLSYFACVTFLFGAVAGKLGNFQDCSLKNQTADHLRESDPASSCLALSLQCGFQPGVYTIEPLGFSQRFQTYCAAGGWTLAMKVDGTESTFTYSSLYWTNANVFNPQNVLLDNVEAKIASFHTVSFDEVLLMMKTGDTTTQLIIPQGAQSLLHLFSQGNFIETTIGRTTWLGLVPGSSLQSNCNREGFNAKTDNPFSNSPRVRIGILGNQENDCSSCDSWLGIGGFGHPCNSSAPANSCGNVAGCNAGKNRNLFSMGYLFVR